MSIYAIPKNTENYTPVQKVKNQNLQNEGYISIHYKV